MIKEKTGIQELIDLDKKHFIHPTTAIAQQQADGPSFIFKEGKGIYLTDVTGRTVIDGMASLWNVNIGHGQEEMAEVAKEQMAKLALPQVSPLSAMSRQSVWRLKLLPSLLGI